MHRSVTLAVFASAFTSAVPAQAAPAPWPPVQVARQISPSVVGIVNMQGTPDGPMIARGSGSGLVVRPDGYIVTNDHVVAGASRLRVQLADGRSLEASLVGEDPLTDLAVLHVRTSGLRPALFARPRDIEVGEMAIAIGNPMGPGFARTVTVGVVSGINRSLGLGYAQRALGLIQTDAAINPGNSGGPLCDAEGHVIGINSVKINSYGFESMGFAIPSATVQSVTAALISHGRVQRAWLGISASDAPTGHPHENQAGGGVSLSAVVPGGPADEAGLRARDVIVEIGGHAVRNLAGLYDRLTGYAPGDVVAVLVRRGGRQMKMQVRLQAMPQRAQTAGL